VLYDNGESGNEPVQENWHDNCPTLICYSYSWLFQLCIQILTIATIRSAAFGGFGRVKIMLPFHDYDNYHHINQFQFSTSYGLSRHHYVKLEIIIF